MTETKLHAQQKSAPLPSLTPGRNGFLQRKCDCGSSAAAWAKCEDCDQQRFSLQRAIANTNLQARNTRLERPHLAGLPSTVLRQPGQPLDAETRAFFEPRFGHDFSRVRIHTDVAANQSARAVNSLAYSVGRDVVFGAGQYAPQTKEGKRLLAHELTHVAQQQNAVGLTPKTLDVSKPSDASEREADQVANQIISGGAAPAISAAAAGIHRDVGWAERGRDPYGTAESPWVEPAEPVAEGGTAPACPVKTSGTLSEVSWGETSGLYPSAQNKFEPEKWDQAKTCELLKMRGAIHAVGQRGERVHKGKPKDGDAIHQKLKVYHLTENFPAIDSEIADAGVKWFYLSSQANGPEIHPGTTGTTRVKGYGSFYNIGGGDVKKGDVWVHFYKLKPKTP